MKFPLDPDCVPNCLTNKRLEFSSHTTGVGEMAEFPGQLSAGGQRLWPLQLERAYLLKLEAASLIRQGLKQFFCHKSQSSKLRWRASSWSRGIMSVGVELRSELHVTLAI